MRTIKKSAVVMITVVLMFSWTVSAFAATKIYGTATPDQWMPQKYTGFSYSHDPMQDPRAQKDNKD